MYALVIYENGRIQVLARAETESELRGMWASARHAVIAQGGTVVAVSAAARKSLRFSAFLGVTPGLSASRIRHWSAAVVQSWAWSAASNLGHPCAAAPTAQAQEQTADHAHFFLVVEVEDILLGDESDGVAVDLKG